MHGPGKLRGDYADPRMAEAAHGHEDSCQQDPQSIFMNVIWTAVRWTLALAACASSQAHEPPELSGAELYQHFCASCHGVAARGDGPVAASLNVPVSDLTRIAARNGGRFSSERVRRRIDGQTVTPAHGTSAMPVWGWELYAFKGEDPARRQRVAELVESLVAYLASIQR